MILKLYNFSNDVEFNHESVGILAVANKKLFLNLVTEFYKLQNNYDSQELSLLDNEQNYIPYKDILVCTDFFNNLLQNRTVNNKLQHKIEKDLNLNCELKNKILTHLNGASDTLSELLLEYDFYIDVNEPKIDDFLKFLKVKYQYSIGQSPYKNIIELIDVVSELKLYKVLVLINTYNYLSKHELNEVIKNVKYKKVPTLFIENKEIITAINNETILYIEEDYDDNFKKL